MTDDKVLEVISEMVLGYREGPCGDIIAAVAGLKVKAARYEANKQLDSLLSKIDELSELKDDILSEA